MVNTAEERKKFTREKLLEYFAEALNVARGHMSSPGTRDLGVEEWEYYFQQIEEKIYSHIKENSIDTIQKLKKYFKELGIIWANEAFNYSKNLMWGQAK